MNLDHADFVEYTLRTVHAPRPRVIIHRPAPECLSVKEQLGNLAWRYFAIVATEDQASTTRIVAQVCDIEAALHAAFIAGVRYANERQQTL